MFFLSYHIIDDKNQLNQSNLRQPYDKQVHKKAARQMPDSLIFNLLKKIV